MGLALLARTDDLGAASGDLGAFAVVFPVVEIGDVLVLVAFVPFFATPFAVDLSSPPLGCKAAEVVGSAAVSLVLVSSSSVILSGFELGTMSGVSVPFWGEILGETLGETLGDHLLGGVTACLGDSGIGSLAKFVRNAAAFWAMLSENTSPFSDTGAGVVDSDSLLCLRSDTDADSRLGSRWRPMRPSFSMATKFNRTLERGRGDCEGVGEFAE